MHGNVRDWCWDKWRYDYPAQPQSAPRGPAVGDCHVMRGGSHWAPAHDLRSAYRDLSPADIEYCDVGFRLARGVPSDAGH